MESEKVKEIKEKLQEEIFIANSFGDNLRKVPTKELENLLTLINELESENERLNKSDTSKEESSIEYYNLYKDLKRKNKDLNELCELQRVSIAESFVRENQLKDRIAELEKEKKEHGKKKFLRGWKLGIEEFSARLKEKFNRQEKRFADTVNRYENGLDKVKESNLPTAKYLIGKATGQATMAEKAQYYIDETLKEFIND
jgi:hypothetical protein